MNSRIVIDPKVCHGKPVIRGTRTPVAIVVGSLAGGMSFEDVQREYDVRAALKFAGELVETFIRREDWLSKLSVRLAIVEVWRVRFRPA
jgi:uncharacterized protein (DUF433 family)